VVGERRLERLFGLGQAALGRDQRLLCELAGAVALRTHSVEWIPTFPHRRAQ
jgi:hypothetical protein